MKSRTGYKKLIPFIACFCIIILAAIVIMPMVRKPVNNEVSIDESGCTLPGAEKIYPAVMYGGRKFYWKHMAGPEDKLPTGELPDGYEYVGDIEYTDSGTITEELQFTSTFQAFGTVYSNLDDPDILCLCLTTSWLEDAYVLFQYRESIGLPVFQ